MKVYIIYYKDHEVVAYMNKPTQEQYPGSSFAEGPFANKAEAEARLRWMGRR